jgi:hypothetical protein
VIVNTIWQVVSAQREETLDLLVTIVGNGACGAPNVILHTCTSGAGERLYAVRDVRGTSETLKAHEVGRKAGDVRRSYDISLACLGTR